MNILTVDLEDWFHILDNECTSNETYWSELETRVVNTTTKLLDLFDIHDVKITFFVLGYIARTHPELLQEIRLRGHEIASHGTEHQLVYKNPRDHFECDILKSKELIHAACGVEVTAYRAPGFSINEQSLWAFEILANCGFRVDCSIFPARRSHGGIPSFQCSEPCVIALQSGGMIKELPMGTIKIFGKHFVFAGGGYFRLLPEFIIQNFMAIQKYNMTYFHPRDFDPNQPEIPGISMFRKFKTRIGLKSAFGKLDNLLATEKFIPLGSAVAAVDWENVQRVEL